MLELLSHYLGLSTANAEGKALCEEADRWQEWLDECAITGKCPTCEGRGYARADRVRFSNAASLVERLNDYKTRSRRDCWECDSTGRSDKTGPTWQERDAVADQLLQDESSKQHRAWAAEHNRQYFEKSQP